MEIVIASIIRHLLTLVAGGLLTVGVSEAESHQLAEAATPVVSGAILYGVSQVWSLKDKKAR
ncbi:hypothetical protein UFOVP851_41 [uncultured Caudovirales phage]|jgi:hypothetical protein|uniref:Holin n=1 Tax=uncultured Caudovirales phage TaxID=2100421 RepID=A0A6J5PBM4_9CAUD|nr:hypothetical protein UFOVP851_41 [uncultured Caudovirales phage]